ncbi:peroxisome membrane protein [Gigaspora margarita]|uniref:Peroxisomal membrane protein PEX16 n=1 Tax=Gigaspora margarita TaxID=4874 RepID=A0A8H4ESS5_GIGMA|nr:peroxisome membrane protein [Gigaspora margarita]
MILSLLKKYDDLILNNASQISSIESSLRTLTYVLPGRFADAEFASETLFAALNLIGLYHDSILARAAENLPPSRKPSPSPHNRYTRYWINSSKTYQHASLALTFLQYTDVLLEMGVQKKWGKEIKWKLIGMIEFIKVMCRIILLYKTNERTVVEPTIPRREIDPSIFPSTSNGDVMGHHEQGESDTWVGKYTKRVRDSISVVRSQHSQHYDVNEYLTNKVLMVEDVRKPPDLVHKLHSFGKFCELLYILRPLLYVIALQKYGNKSWRPWLLSISIEMSTIILMNYFYKTQIPGGCRWLSTLEKEERKRRFRQFFFYILRGPFYEQFTRPKINNFCNSVCNKPILSLFGGILRDYQPLWENIYFYTASS